MDKENCISYERRTTMNKWAKFSVSLLVYMLLIPIVGALLRGTDQIGVIVIASVLLMLIRDLL